MLILSKNRIYPRNLPSVIVLSKKTHHRTKPITSATPQEIMLILKNCVNSVSKLPTQKTHHRTEKDFTQIHQSSTGNHQFNLPSHASDDRQIFMFAGSHDYAQRTRSCDADVGMGNDAQRPNPRARN